MTADRDRSLSLLAEADIAITPDLEGITTLGFDRATDAIAKGQEAARGQALYVTEEAAAQAPDEDFFYNSDLIGCTIRDAEDDSNLGEAVDVIELPGHNLIEVKNGDKVYHVPFVAAMVVDIDLEARMIRVLLPEGLDDLDKL